MSSCFFFLPTILFLKSYCMYIFYNSTSCSWGIIQYLLNYFYAIAIFGPFPQSPGNTSNVINRIFSGFSGRARKHSCDCLEIFITCLEIFITGPMFTKSPWMVHLMMLVHLPGLIAECCPREIFSWGNKSSYKLYSPHNHATNYLLPY